jgi:hypothetical protein
MNISLLKHLNSSSKIYIIEGIICLSTHLKSSVLVPLVPFIMSALNLIFVLTPKNPWVFWCKTTQNYPLLIKGPVTNF